MNALLAVALLATRITPGATGYATWYDDGPGLYGAVPSWHYGDTPYPVQVCHLQRCVTVIVRDYCACGDRGSGATVIDLSPAAFSQLAPLSRGVISVRIEETTLRPPATDTWVRDREMTDFERLLFWTGVLGVYVAMTRWLKRRLR